MLRLIAIVLIALAICVNAGADHSHDHSDSNLCACVAKKNDFTINCKDVVGLLSSLNYLKENRCNMTSDSCKNNVACSKHYYKIQSAHDYCHHDELPEAVEKDIHDFEAGCSKCHILRKFNSSLPICTKPTCSDKTVALNAYNALKSGSCNTNCASSTCGANYRIIRAYHDLCEHDDIPQEVEEGIHDFEVVCAAQNCNPTSSNAHQLECTTDAHEHGSSSSSSHTDVALVVVSICLLLAILVIAFLLRGRSGGKGKAERHELMPVRDVPSTSTV